ncbi:hypothetical protein [Sorangium sp. So ce341]|uniref:hypothetical protein n=1 Tax=Sorangium sp. So ce341 TaxID=3133302 RepID=UPI003F6078EB
MRKTFAFSFVLALGSASVALAGSSAGQWALRGPYDVDLIEGNDTALDFQPASAEPVVIGLIDTGVDYQHSSLAGALWRDPGEIAGNCVDDDDNGYIDDLHGIRVDVGAFDDVLEWSPDGLRAAFEGACAEHGGAPSGGECLAGSESDATDIRAIAGRVGKRSRTPSKRIMMSRARILGIVFCVTSFVACGESSNPGPGGPSAGTGGVGGSGAGTGGGGGATSGTAGGGGAPQTAGTGGSATAGSGGAAAGSGGAAGGSAGGGSAGGPSDSEIVG